MMLTLFEFIPPSLDYLLLAPFLVVLGTACLGILVEAFVPRKPRFIVQLVLAVLGLIMALVLIVWNWGSPNLADPWSDVIISGTVMIDGPTMAFWALLFGFGLLAIILFAERNLHAGATSFTSSAASVPGSNAETEAADAGLVHTEVFPLAIFALSGAGLLVAANDLLVLFIGLEILSLPLYVMVGLARHRRVVSQEASLKYFLLGAMASAILLFGVAFLFGHTGSFDYAALSRGVTFSFGDSLLLAGIALIGVGLLFKIGAVPFHSWVPDVYQGAPTPVTAFMSVCTKTAAVAAFLRLFYAGLGGMRLTWQPVLAGVAILTILVGSIIAINQMDIKRVLAYSAVSHAGFILVPLVGAATLTSGMMPGTASSVASIMFYLVAYGFAALGAFAIVTLVRSQGREVTDLAAWAGIGKRDPVIAVIFLIFLLSMAGIPLTAGFVGKYIAFVAAWQGGYWWLAMAGVLGAIIAVYIYVRVVQIMFFKDPDGPTATITQAGPATWIVMILCVIGTVAFGIVPGPLLDLLQSVSTFILPAGS
ncbi:MAG: NADH-quinone oxidoreductase subunit NuoN [Propionibacteriaceae bacterium]|jgi:NADH-quinone oxidoreductase subunit N|nr:NADH-quinone oxidoreductase subunit NuoN [Propionibacteriaceae bacterium]